MFNSSVIYRVNIFFCKKNKYIYNYFIGYFLSLLLLIYMIYILTYKCTDTIKELSAIAVQIVFF